MVRLAWLSMDGELITSVDGLLAYALGLWAVGKGGLAEFPSPDPFFCSATCVTTPCNSKGRK